MVQEATRVQLVNRVSQVNEANLAIQELQVFKNIDLSHLNLIF